jgi:hypothetical protein
MDGLCQLSQGERLDRILSSFEVDDCAHGNCRLARKTSGGKLLRFCPDLIDTSDRPLFRIRARVVLLRRRVLSCSPYTGSGFVYPLSVVAKTN